MYIQTGFDYDVVSLDNHIWFEVKDLHLLQK